MNWIVGPRLRNAVRDAEDDWRWICIAEIAAVLTDGGCTALPASVREGKKDTGGSKQRESSNPFHETPMSFLFTPPSGGAV